MKTHGHLHIAYACTDVHTAYSVVNKYAFRNCASNMASQVLPGYPHRLCRRLYEPVKESITQLTRYYIIHLKKVPIDHESVH